MMNQGAQIEIISSSPQEYIRKDYLHYPWEKLPGDLQKQVISFTTYSYRERGLLEGNKDKLPVSDFEGRIFYISTLCDTNDSECFVVGVAGIKTVSTVNDLPMLLTFKPPIRDSVVKFSTLSTEGQHTIFMEIGKFAVSSKLPKRLRWQLFNKGIEGIVDYVKFTRSAFPDRTIVIGADTLALPKRTGLAIKSVDTSAGFVLRIVDKLKRYYKIDYNQLSLNIKRDSTGTIVWGIDTYDEFECNNPLVDDENSIYARGVVDSWLELFEQEPSLSGSYKVITFHKIRID